MDEGSKKVTKVLSTDDIRQQAQNWNLAGDAGLLAHLEQFSEKIFSKTQETNSQLNDLIECFEEVHKITNNVTNQFLSLQNCQFVENRVYDEESPTEENIKEQVVDENEREKQLLQQYKEAVDFGVRLLDTHFEAVELPPNSDSDDDFDGCEDGGNLTRGNVSLIWKPKNPYSGKKFPLLIGSSEWWEDDKVGLGEPEEHSPTEREASDSGSDSDEEQSRDKINQDLSSSSVENEKLSSSRPSNQYESSEDLFGLGKDNTFKGSDSDLFGAAEDSVLGKSEIFSSKFEKGDIISNSKHDDGKSEEPTVKEVEKAPVKQAGINRMENDFTRELASKLGNFAQNDVGSASAKDKPPETIGKEVGKEKIFESVHDSDYLFGDDSNDNDLFSDEVKKLPVEKKYLFLEEHNDSELFGGSNKLFAEPQCNLFESKDGVRVSPTPSADDSGKADVDQKSGIPKKSLPVQESPSDLFRDLQDDDEDDVPWLFSKPGVKIESEHKSFSDSPSEPDIVSKNKPLTVPSEGKTIVKVGTSKGLFDSDGEGDDIFQTESRNKTGKYPATTVKSDEDSSDLFFDTFSVPALKTKEDAPSKSAFKESVSIPSVQDQAGARPAYDDKLSLFGDAVKDDVFEEAKPKFISGLDDDEDDTSLFLKKSRQPDSVSISSSRSSLFEEAIGSKSRLASVFEKDKNNIFASVTGSPLSSSVGADDDLFNPSDNSLFGQSFGCHLASKIDDGELFRSTTPKKVNEKSSLFGDEDDDLFKDAKETKQILAKDSLFEKPKQQHSALSVAVAEVKPIKKISDDLFEKEPVNAESKKYKGEDLFDGTGFDSRLEDIFSKDDFFSGIDAEVDELFRKVSVPSTKELKVENVAKENTEEPVGECLSSHAVEEDTKINSKKNTIFGLGNNIQEKVDVDDDVVDDLFDSKENKDLPSPSPSLSASTTLDFATCKPKPPVSLNIKDLSTAAEPSGKGKSIGKLNIPQNLKTCLEATVKPISSDLGPQVGLRKPVTLPGEVNSQEKSFDSSSPNLLKCPSRDRVKIPVRRRPQSRRARQEAIRNSGVIFLDVDEEDVLDNGRSVKSKSNDLINGDNQSNKSFSQEKDASLPSPSPELCQPKSHPLSPSTDEEDLFNMPGLDKNFEKEDHSLFRSNLFEASGNNIDDDNLLFDGGPILSPQAGGNEENFLGRSGAAKESKREDGKLNESKKNKTDNIFNFNDNDTEDDFGIDDDEGNLFKTKGKSEDFLKVGKTFVPGVRKTSLFDDNFDQEDDDLFGQSFDKSKTTGASSSANISEASKPAVLPPAGEKKEIQGKNSSSQPFVDPLGLMSQKD